MEQSQLTAIWEQLLAEIQQSIKNPMFATWIQPNTLLHLDEQELVIGTPNQIRKDWLESKYMPVLQQAAERILKRPMHIKVSLVETSTEETAPSPIITPPVTAAPLLQNISPLPAAPLIEADNTQYVSSASASATVNDPVAFLNPKYIFETFVIGNSNRLAHAASLAVSEAPAKVYNPFFIYGGVGLGKTHLMHAIGHRILKSHPHLKVLYISSEKFTNELINSIRDGNPEDFRQKYRNIDVLLVDDIQFLSKKEHTQEEFFHTFNTLHEANKQIIISSDRPPREIQTLEDRLRSRFEWGMIADIQAPDLETRIAILRKKAIIENLDVPNDVIVFIASRIDSNIRELEGSLIRVMAYASLVKQPVTIALATETLKDIFPANQPRQITVELIQDIVAVYFKLKVDDLLAKKRTRNVTYPRQIAMYLARELTDTSLPRIGEMFGGRDHTTVIHAYDKIGRERNEDAKLTQTLKELVKRIENV